MARRREIVVLKSIAAVARFFQVDRHTVTDWLDKGCPQKSKTEFELDKIVAWWGKHIAAPKFASGGDDSMAELKLKREQQQYRRDELKYAKEVQAVIPWLHVEEFHDRFASHLRKAGDLLRKHHGEEAQQILLDAITAAEKDHEGAFGE